MLESIDKATAEDVLPLPPALADHAPRQGKTIVRESKSVLNSKSKKVL